MAIAANFWNDENGAIISAELVLVLSILVLGMVAGLSTFRDAILLEYVDMSYAIGSINQSYQINPVVGRSSYVGGSRFIDENASSIDKKSDERNDDSHTGITTPSSPLVQNNVYVSQLNSSPNEMD